MLFLSILYIVIYSYLFTQVTESTRVSLNIAFGFIGMGMVLLLLILSFINTKGFKKKFIGFIAVGMSFYFSGKIVLMLQQPLPEATALWDLTNILNLLYISIYILSFTLLILPIRNRINFLYYSFDTLIVFVALFIMSWHWWISSLVQPLGLPLSTSFLVISYPIIQFLLFIGLLLTVFIKRYFFPRLALLLFSISMGIQLGMESFFVFNRTFFQGTILELVWMVPILLQSMAITRLVKDKREFKLGESVFYYKDYSHSLWRNILSGMGILSLFLLYTSTDDIVVGIGFISIIFFLFLRQLLSSYQYKRLAGSYQLLSRNLEGQIEARTVELQEKNEELQRTFTQLEHMAMHDQLTGLPNRRGLKVEIDRLMKKETPFSLVFMDIDQFKEVNDRYGHSYGDQLLVEFTKRFTSLLPNGSMLARQSGDEFIIVHHVHKREEILSYSKELLLLCKKPFQVMEKQIHVTFSAGIAIYPEHGSDIEDLMKSADQAMYKVKEQGKDNFHIVC